MALRGMHLGLRHGVESESGLPVAILFSLFLTVSVNHFSSFLGNPFSTFLIHKQNNMVVEGDIVKLSPSKQ